MCGIAGIFSFNGQKVSLHTLKKMTDAIAHRGPDGEGHWINEQETVALGHRRLSVIDLSEKAKQPMPYLNHLWITYNGEIYNYLELRNELRQKGYVFYSNSDTEVILAAYHAYGEQCLSKFDGMFAFALWDTQKQEMFCARDRFGEKPFFFSTNNGQFVFGSELKSLFAQGVSKEINKRMQFLYLNYDVVENSNCKRDTFYEKIHSLEASHYLKIDQHGKFYKKKYWDLSPKPNNEHATFEDACSKFKELFYDSISKRLRSDVAVGSSLSGGIDSSSVVMAINGLQNEHGGQQTFSARFKDSVLDEGKFIELVTKPNEINAFNTFPDVNTLVKDLDQLFYHQEQPFGSASIFAQWEVMKLAKEKNVTVLLDGQGADEMLAGYPKHFNTFFKELYLANKNKCYQEVEAFEKLHRTKAAIDLKFKLNAQFNSILNTAGRFKRKFSNSSNNLKLHPDYYTSFKTIPSPFQHFNNLNKELHHSMTHYGLEKLLRFSDRNSMAHSREVRLPFLSHRLVEFVFSLPSDFKMHNGWSKFLLRESMHTVLPDQIKNRVDKIGFETPQNDWLKNKEMSELVHVGREFLTKENFITEESQISDWQAIMTYKLHHTF